MCGCVWGVAVYGVWLCGRGVGWGGGWEQTQVGMERGLSDGGHQGASEAPPWAGSSPPIRARFPRCSPPGALHWHPGVLCVGVGESGVTLSGICGGDFPRLRV